MGRPPRIAACLAGACPIPAESTLPNIASSIYCGGSSSYLRAPLMQIPANCGPVRCESFPI